MTGDFILTANFEFIGNKGDNHRKYGWMIRESLDDAAAHVSASGAWRWPDCNAMGAR